MWEGGGGIDEEKRGVGKEEVFRKYQTSFDTNLIRKYQQTLILI
jgi:hypothetical protein